MMRKCEVCGLDYDDARCDTGCPHPALMSDADLARKDLANDLLSHDLVLRDDPLGSRYRIQSIGWNGFVTLQGLTGNRVKPQNPRGEFSPDRFMRATPAIRARHITDSRFNGVIEAYEFENRRGRVFVRTDTGEGYWHQPSTLTSEPVRS